MVTIMIPQIRFSDRPLTPYKYWDRVILYLFVPLFVIIIICREHPRI
jgi:hypothetical protein